MKKLIIQTLIVLTIIINGTSAVFCQDQDDATYYYNLGYAKLVDGSFKEAINIFNQTLQINPESSEAYLGLGIAYRQIDDLDKALEATKKALEFNPDYFKAYYNLALIYEQQGQIREAIKAYKIFFKKVPEARNIPDLKDKIKELNGKI